MTSKKVVAVKVYIQHKTVMTSYGFCVFISFFDHTGEIFTVTCNACNDECHIIQHIPVYIFILVIFSF